MIVYVSDKAIEMMNNRFKVFASAYFSNRPYGIYVNKVKLTNKLAIIEVTHDIKLQCVSMQYLEMLPQ